MKKILHMTCGLPVPADDPRKRQHDRIFAFLLEQLSDRYSLIECAFDYGPRRPPDSHPSLLAQPILRPSWSAKGMRTHGLIVISPYPTAGRVNYEARETIPRSPEDLRPIPVIAFAASAASLGIDFADYSNQCIGVIQKMYEYRHWDPAHLSQLLYANEFFARHPVLD